MSQPRATCCSRSTKSTRMAATALVLLSAAGLHAFPILEEQPSGPGIAPFESPAIPAPDARAAWVAPGYKVEVVVQDLEYPTSVEFDNNGNMFIAEAGYAYGDPWGRPRILKVTPSGDISVLADQRQQLQGPINDLLWYQDRLYISHRGKISYLQGRRVVDLVCGLPASGDHQNNQMSVGPDGRIYFGMGVVTNSGVVGLDNLKFLWLHLWPHLSDQSPYDLCFQGHTFASANPLFVFTQQDPKWAPHLMALTSPFHAYGSTGGKVAAIGPKANGTILALDPSLPDGSNLQVHAWGLRNPYGVAWSPDGQLYSTDNGYDERGSRPIANAPDSIFCIKPGGWYGWPDYAAGCPVTDPRFRSDRGPAPKFLLRNHPPVEQPLTTQPPHSGVTKLAVNSSPRFGNPGDLFIAQYGSGAPVTGEDPAISPIPQILRMNPATRQKETFFRVREEFAGDKNTAVSSPGPRHMIEPYLTRSGNALYVADFGAVTIIPSGIGYLPRPFPGTGVIWRITPEGSGSHSPPANLSANP